MQSDWQKKCRRNKEKMERPTPTNPEQDRMTKDMFLKMIKRLICAGRD